MRDDTSKPLRTRSLANFVDDFDVQRSNDIGLPRVSGWTSSSRASSRPGCFSLNGRSPPPVARRRSGGSHTSRHFRSCLDDGVAAHAGSVGHHRLAASPKQLGSRAGNDPTLALVQVGQDHIEEPREPLRRELHTATILRAYYRGVDPNGTTIL